MSSKLVQVFLDNFRLINFIYIKRNKRKSIGIAKKSFDSARIVIIGIKIENSWKTTYLYDKEKNLHKKYARSILVVYVTTPIFCRFSMLSTQLPILLEFGIEVDVMDQTSILIKVIL